MTRQKTSKRLLLVMLLCVIMVVSLALTACNGGKHVITWNIDEHATVTVEGAKKLPEKAKDGEAIEFTITTDAGYVVDEVLRDNKTVNANSAGKYSVTVSADVTITVTTKREISGITVTQKPTKLVYEAGETLDKTGMVVQLEHTVGEPETITDYRIRYQGGTAASGFQLGDTNFQVYYEDHFATVQLDEVVAAHITLDLVGATVSDDYIATLSAIEGIQDVKQENGLVTFKFTAPLTSDIDLPTREQVAKGEEEGDYIFNAWQINGEGDWISSLSSETVTSQVVKANFTANLAVIDSVDYEDVDGVPYLIINGTFKAAKSVYTLLTEGNRSISFPFDNAQSGNRGESFTLRANMLELTSATAQDGGSFVGPWLDLRIAYDVDGRTENMELPYDASYERISVVDGEEAFRFGFAQWGGNLKIAITVLAPYSYTLAVDNENDVLTLTIDGQIIKALDRYVGARVIIDWWMDATIGPVEAVIAEDGSWQIVFELSPDNGFILNTLGYAHFKIVDANGSELYKDGEDGNLLANPLANRDELTHHDIPHGQFNGDSLEIANADGTIVYYVGIPDWDAIVIYGFNPLAPKFSVSGDVELKVDDFEQPTKVYYLVKLTVEKNLTEDEVFAIVLGNIDGTTDVFSSDRQLSTINGNVYTLWFDITDYSGSQLWPNLYMPVGEGDDVTYEKCSEEVGGDSDHSSDGLYAIVNGIKYSIVCSDGTWDRPCVVTETAQDGETNPPAVNPDENPSVDPDPGVEPDPDDPVYTVIGVTLTVDGNKVYFIISGTYANYEEADISALVKEVYFDFEMRGNPWTRHPDLEREVAITASAWTIKFDVTDIPAHANPYTAHFGASDSNLTANSEQAIDGTRVTLNGVNYTLVNHPDSNAEMDNWGAVSLKISEVGNKSLNYTGAALELKDDNVYLVLTANFEEYTEAELETIKYFENEDTDGAKVPKASMTLTVEKVEITGTTVKLYFNFTNVDANGEWWWGHWSINGENQGDVKSPVTENEIVFNGKRYVLKTEWDMPYVVVTNV